jgi:serine/threonine-protein kinase
VIEVGSAVGNYQVLQKIGSGAMGAVFLAAHPVIGKRVALKVIHPELANNEEMVGRFFNEARAVTQIGHDNIVDVQDFGQTPDGESFIVMELLEGESLGARMKREGAFSVPRATHVAMQIADGLAAAHARGIIHRDLKPDNIMLISRGGDQDYVKILDFGLAKLQGPGAMQNKTKTGSLLGTPHYMAPEQCEGKRAIDHRVDVYALGCILFQMLTGRVPFPGEGFGEVLVKHLREPPPLPTRLNPQVPKHLETIILHALAKKPEFRFAGMDDFRAALRDPERFAQKMDASALEVNLTPSEPIPAPFIPPGVAMGTPPPAAAPPPGAPQRLDASAPTVMGAAPDPQRVQAARQQQAAAFDVATAPGQRRLERPTVSQPHKIGKRPRARNNSAIIAIGAGLGLLGVLGFAGWFFVGRGSTVSVAVKSTPDGAEVVQDGRVIGRAPLVLALPRGDQKVTLEVRKEGFLSSQRSVTPTSDLEVTVRLLPKPAADPEPPAPEVKKPEPAPEAATAMKPPERDPKKHHSRKKKEGSPLLLTPSF